MACWRHSLFHKEAMKPYIGYNNETSYTSQMVRTIKYFAELK